MLIELHEAIAKICPIDSIADLGNGNYQIRYSLSATPAEQEAAQQTLDNPYASKEERQAAEQLFTKFQATPEQQAAAQQLLTKLLTAQPSTEPLWDLFRSRILVDGGYIRIVTSHAANQAWNPVLVGLLWRVGDNPELLLEAANLWNQMVKYVPPLLAEVPRLKQIAVDCKMPFVINDKGEMILKTT